MNALANPKVGNYFNTHFVCTFQKVGSFRLVNGQKQGGNVASYFCTPANGVLNAVAGPVDAATLLREARWVVETHKLALLQARGDLAGYTWSWHLAHEERLETDQGSQRIDWQRLPVYAATEPALTWYLDQPVAQRLDNQGKIHLLLAVYPLAPLDQCYRVVYEKIVGEHVSGQPVTEAPR